MADFIGHPAGKVLAVFDRAAETDRAIEALNQSGVAGTNIERFEGAADADRFRATGSATVRWPACCGPCRSA